MSSKLVFALFAISFLVCFPAHEATKAQKSRRTTEHQSYENLQRYKDKYPCRTNFFRIPVVTKALRRILGPDYMAYRKHLLVAGCGQMSATEGLLYADVSQLNVGGYSSLVFVDINHDKMYLFWLKGTVADKDYRIYGDRPIPETVSRVIEEEMNESWGHVAEFRVTGDKVTIRLRNK